MMKLPNNVKPKNWLWNLIPWISEKTAQAIYPNVYVPKFVYKNLLSKNQNPYHIALILHEEEHIKRQKSFGPSRWFIKYLLSPKFRFDEEIEADKPKLKYLKNKKLNTYLENRAKMLSGWNYFWPVSFEFAKKTLDRIYKGI